VGSCQRVAGCLANVLVWSIEDAVEKGPVLMTGASSGVLNG